MPLYLDNGVIRTYNEQVDHLTKEHRKQLLENDSFQNSINELKKLQPELNELTQRVNNLLNDINNINIDIDTLQNSKADIDIVIEKDKLLQTTGQEVNNTMSQKAITDAINNIEIPPQLKVVQVKGTSETDVMSQKATSDAVDTVNRDLIVYKETTDRTLNDNRLEVDRISSELNTAKNNIRNVEVIANNANMQAGANLEKINTINDTTIPAINKNITDNVNRIDGDIGSLDATKADASDVVSKIDVAQETGNSTTKVMSQDAVTRELAKTGVNIKVVQVKGTSQVDVMSQKATSDAVDKVNRDLIVYKETTDKTLNDNRLEVDRISSELNTAKNNIRNVEVTANNANMQSGANLEKINTINDTTIPAINKNVNKVSADLETAKTDIITNSNNIAKFKIKNVVVFEEKFTENDIQGVIIKDFGNPNNFIISYNNFSLILSDLSSIDNIIEVSLKGINKNGSFVTFYNDVITLKADEQARISFCGYMKYRNDPLTLELSLVSKNRRSFVCDIYIITLGFK